MRRSTLWERRIDRQGFMAASAFAALAAASLGRLGRGGLRGDGGQAVAFLLLQLGRLREPEDVHGLHEGDRDQGQEGLLRLERGDARQAQGGARGYDLAVRRATWSRSWPARTCSSRSTWTKLPNVGEERRPEVPACRSTRRPLVDPKDWGTTGFIYRTDLVKERPRTWREFFVLFEDEVREGHAPRRDPRVGRLRCSSCSATRTTRTRASELDAAKQELLDLKPHLLSITSTESQAEDHRGQGRDGLGWNGDGPRSSSAKKPADYVVAEEGGEFWIDSYVIPVGAKNPDAAHRWIDFVYQPPSTRRRRGTRTTARRSSGGS